jgi:hypothetical protein
MKELCFEYVSKKDLADCSAYFFYLDWSAQLT